MPSFQKMVYVRSKALMEAYRKIECQSCARDDGTVCGAHSNWAVHGHGRSIKATDTRCASLCWTCHRDLDQGSNLSTDERKDMWWTAHLHTVRELVSRGLWPKDIPAPCLGEECKP